MDATKVSTAKENFEALFESCCKQLFAIALTKTRDYHDAQDAVQEAFYYAYKNICTLKNEEFFKTWITKILLNYLNKYYKDKKQCVNIDQFYNDINLSTNINSATDDIVLMDALKKLDKNHCDVVILRFFVGYSVPEIAKSIGIPEGTVKSRLSRSLKKLKTVLWED